MSFATLDDLQAAQRLSLAWNQATAAAETGNEWATIGTIPTTATTPGTVHSNDSPLGNFPTLSPIEKFMTEFMVTTSSNSAVGAYMLLDRLVGVNQVITTTGVKTINSSALSRYTTGEGVMVFVEVTVVTATNACVLNLNSYTNSNGDTGRSGANITFPSTAYNVGNWMLFPLQAGDSGVRSVESINVTTASGGSGAINVVLAKPLTFSGVINGPSGMPAATLMEYIVPQRIFDGASLCCLIKGYSGAERSSGAVVVALDS